MGGGGVKNPEKLMTSFMNAALGISIPALFNKYSIYTSGIKELLDRPVYVLKLP